MQNYKIIKPEDIQENTFSLIGKDWMLITAGSLDNFNTMTASWGTLGVLWSKKICICFVRPSRYTYEFMERENSFSLSFFGDEYRQALNFCGSNSGRDVDKIKATGLTPFETENGIVSFEQAKLIITCNKIYTQNLDPENYIGIMNPDFKNDCHKMYFGEIRSCMIKE